VALPTPDVTVIIPAYNSMPYVKKALASVFEQTLGMDRIEVIAVNDGSTDGTGDEFDRVAAEHPNVRVFHEPNSGGPARPRNVALDSASGRYVFFLDADDYLNPESLERMVRCADEQGSDVVLGRLFGVGGRRPPKAMFVATQLSTTVFDSRVWWALNILKLYRRELIERLGLRFREDIFSEDQPFTGTCFLNAKAISVLADYDYAAFVWREDMGNATLSDIPLHQLTDALGVMIELITENVEAGPSRNLLLKRHYEVEFFKTFKAMTRATDDGDRQEAFNQLRDWALEYFPYEVVEDLSPAHRVTYRLLIQGDLDALVSFVRQYVVDPEWDVSVEGELVYTYFPCLRGGGADLPKECFEVTPLIKVRHELTAVAWRDEVLHLEGHAHLDILDSGQTSTELVLRERATQIEYALPVTRHATPGNLAVLWQSNFEQNHAAISVAIDPLTAADGGRLPDGVWDLSLRLSSQGITREARIGRVRASEIDDAFQWRLLPADSEDGMVVGSYFTEGFGNLCPEHAINVLLVNDAGQECGAETTFEDDRFSASIDLHDVVHGGLKPGDWELVIRTKAGRATTDIAARPSAQLSPMWLWLAAWPHRVSASGPGAPLVLHVRRLSLSLLRRGVSRKRTR